MWCGHRGSLAILVITGFAINPSAENPIWAQVAVAVFKDVAAWSYYIDFKAPIGIWSAFWCVRIVIINRAYCDYTGVGGRVPTKPESLPAAATITVSVEFNTSSMVSRINSSYSSLPKERLITSAG